MTQDDDDGASYSSAGFAGDDGMNEQIDDTSLTEESPKKRNGAKHTLVPVTTRQISRATQDEDVFLLGNREIFKVSLVGQVLDLVEQQTSTNFNFWDETGTIGARMWEPDDQEPSEQQKRWRREGAYVRVIANVKSFANHKRLMVQSVELVEDMNQLTHHLASVILVHLQFLHGTDQPQQAQQGGPLDLTQMIQQIFEVDQTPEGLGIEGIQMQLESQFGVSATVEDTTTVINYLLEGSFLYPGLDEHHWKAC